MTPLALRVGRAKARDCSVPERQRGLGVGKALGTKFEVCRRPFRMRAGLLGNGFCRLVDGEHIIPFKMPSSIYRIIFRSHERLSLRN